jgi:DNA-binding transcriptional LysR family regulator
MDWDDIRTFLAITRTGTLSGAARALGVGQSTMSRRLAAQEERAGAQLLQKTAGGYELTALGESVLGCAERMEAEAMAIERAVVGRDAKLVGVVRVTTTYTLAALLLPAAIASLRQQHPEITVELIEDSRLLNLSRREADVAIRMDRFEDNQIFARRIGHLHHALYASESYLAAYGPLNGDGAGHEIITALADQTFLPEPSWLSANLPAARVALRTRSREVQGNAVRIGLGMALLSTLQASTIPGLVEVVPPAQIPSRPIWLGVHEDLRHMARTRVVMDSIIAAVQGSEFLV